MQSGNAQIYHHVHTQYKQEYDNQIDSDTDVLLKDDQDTIQASKSTCQAE